MLHRMRIMCGTFEMGRPHEFRTRPFRQGEFVYATDSTIVARIPTAENTTIQEIPAIDDAPDMMGGSVAAFWDHDAITDWEALPDIPSDLPPCPDCDGTLLGRKTCPECDGEGDVDLDSDYNEYHVECKTCKGGGSVLDTEASYEDVGVCTECEGTGKNLSYPVPYGQRAISARLLKKMRVLPGCKISPYYPSGTVRRDQPFRFIFDGGGQGFAMPMRDWR